MVRKKTRNVGVRQFVDLENGLHEVNRDIINITKTKAHQRRILIERIVERLICAMRRNSKTFSYLYWKKWVGGSVFDGLKITEPDEFDVHIVLRLPERFKPILVDSGAPPSHVKIQIQNQNEITKLDNEIRKDIANFIDAAGYVLAENVKNSFFKSVLDKTLNKNSSNGQVKMGKQSYKIERIQQQGPAFVLSLDLEGAQVKIDLVAGMALPGNQWPKNGFRANQFSEYGKQFQSFGLVAKNSKIGGKVQRQWQLNFQVQEKKILHDRCFLKPTIRIIKRMRDFLGQDKVSSYAIKTMFLWELSKENAKFDENTPHVWNGPLSYCVALMLTMYLKYLQVGRIPYFWNQQKNLIENVSKEELNKYSLQISRILLDIKENPRRETIKKYLCLENHINGADVV